MSRVLVTGGAGFLGSHVATALLAKGHEVSVLDDYSGGCAANIPKGAVSFRGTITDRSQVATLFADLKFEYVFHLAAFAAENLSHNARIYTYENIVLGSANIVNACILHGVKRLVFTSSIAVYGDGEPPFTEETPPRPIDPYGIAKRAAEQDIIAAQRVFGLDYTIFRPHNIYGERQNLNDKYRNVVGIWMNQIMRGEPLTIFGDGKQQRAFSYVGDVAPLIADAAFNSRARNETFNIGADAPYSILQLADAVEAAMGTAGNPRVMLPARHEAKMAYCSHEKLGRYFGPREQTPLREGLDAMAKWATACGPQKRPPFPFIEIARGLPEAWK